MTILQINRRPKVVTAVDSNAPNTHTEQTLSDQTTQQEQSTPNSGQVANQDAAAVDEQQTTPTVQLTLTGPLSEVYTRALNAIYAIENMVVLEKATDTPTGVDQNNETIPQAVIYAIGLDDLQMPGENVAGSGNRIKLALDCVKVSNKVTTVLAIEQRGILNEHKSNVIEYLKACSVKVAYSPRQAIALAGV